MNTKFITITLIYNDLSDRQKIETYEGKNEVFIEYLDRGSKLCKKKAATLMEDWGARLLPFAIISEGEKVTKCLYSEADDVISKLKEIL